MRIKKNAIATALGVFLTIGAAGCGEATPIQRELTESELAQISAFVPDYSSSTKQFEFFGYSAVSNGYWTENGVNYYAGENLVNLEKLTLYKDAGMTFMHPQGHLGIQAADNFIYEGSALEYLFNEAQAAGIGRVIVPDFRFNAFLQYLDKGLAAHEAGEEEIVAYEQLLEKDKGTISWINDWFTVDGELDLEQVDETVKLFMGEYSQHESFFGVILWDEVSWALFDGYAQVYKAIKRNYPDAYTLCNLFPPVFNETIFEGIEVTEEEKAKYSHTQEKETFAKWEKYISTFIDKTGIDYLMWDQYPLTENGVHRNYLLGLQIAAKVCQEKGVKFQFVTQSYSPDNKRVVNAEDANWLNNMLLGFGVSTLGYYTYYPRTGESIGNFVNFFGEPTDLYYVYQEVHKRNQAFAPTILCFNYQQSVVIVNENSSYSGQYITNGISTGDFAKVSSVDVDKETALITELYDGENERYMYMVQNVVDARYTGSKSWQTTTLHFSENYGYALVYKNGGEKQVLKLVNNEYTVTQHPGEAMYVIPFNV